MSTNKIIQCIAERCERDHWYGAELHGPWSQHIQDADPRRSAFIYPPATEEQLHASEATLGFSLPPLLRALYATLANGGFGPGTGIRGALGGYGAPVDEPAYTILGYDAFHRTQQRPISLTDAGDAIQWQHDAIGDFLLLPDAVWPAQTLALCDLGCCQTACLDCQSGQLYCSAPGEHDDSYLLWKLAPSLESWLVQWLAAEPVR
jgi:hypothetical protein